MPLPQGASVGFLPDGTLVWVDSQGNALNPDGTPMPGVKGRALPPSAPGSTAPAPAPDSSPAGGVNIAPAGSGAVPPAAAPAAPAPAATTQPTGPAQGPPSPGGLNAGGYTVAQITAQSDQELLQANADVAKLWDEINAQRQAVADLQAGGLAADPTGSKLQNATSQLNAQYSTLSAAMQRVETANASRATTLQKAIDAATLDPSQVDLAKAQASKATSDADLSKTQRDVLQQGSQGQRDLVAAQATQASAAAAASLATAAATTAKTPAEVAQLQAEAKALNAQADQTTALLPGLIDKQKAETGLTVAQTDLTGSQSQLAKAQATQAVANAGLADAQAKQVGAQTTQLVPAQAALATAQAGLATAQAAGAQADIQQKLQGPTYGLQDQLKAIQTIHDQVFGPNGSGSPEQRRQQADDLLSQYFNATVGGTTPYAASVAAANAGLTAYGTQMSGTNALQAAQASRAAAYAGLAGSELGTLAGMNAYAPKGSTAMAGAFQYLQDDMAKRMAAQFPTAPIPNAPALPSYLQQFANPAGAPPAPGGAPMPAGAPAAPPAAGPPVFNPQASTAAMNAGGFMDTPAGRAAMAATNPALLASRGAPAAPPAAAGPALPASVANYATPGGGVTPQQAFANGFQSNLPSFPNVLQMYGLNMPSPMQMLGGQPYVGMGV